MRGPNEERRQVRREEAARPHRGAGLGRAEDGRRRTDVLRDPAADRRDQSRTRPARRRLSHRAPSNLRAAPGRDRRAGSVQGLCGGRALGRDPADIDQVLEVETTAISVYWGEVSPSLVRIITGGGTSP